MPGDHTLIYYRRVIPTGFNLKKEKVKPGAFHLRASKDEPALSVYDSSRVSPRDLLANFISDMNLKLGDSDPEVVEKAKDMLLQHGETPEEMYDKGWRIVKLPNDMWQHLGFIIEPTRDDGHVNISAPLGTDRFEYFKEFAIALAERSVVLSKEETLCED